MPQPTFEELETLVSAYSQTGYIAEALSEAANINSLNGKCVHYSRQLQKFVKERVGINLSEVCSSLQRVHTYLEAETKDRGKVIIDSTLGQFICYPRIFLGTKDELRGLFLDESRELLLGDSIWATKEKIETRERWFEILYD